MADVQHASLLQEALHCHGRMSRNIVVQKKSASIKNVGITFKIHFNNPSNICTQNLFIVSPSDTIFFEHFNLKKNRYFFEFCRQKDSNAFHTFKLHRETLVRTSVLTLEAHSSFMESNGQHVFNICGSVHHALQW